MKQSHDDVELSFDINLQDVNEVLPERAKILYVQPLDVEFLRYLILHKDVDVTIMDHDIRRIEVYTRQSIKAQRGYCEHDLRQFNHQEFDYLILDRILQANSVPDNVLCDAAYIAKYVIATITNYGHISRRMSFAKTGSFFAKDNKEKWYNSKIVRPCSIIEFMQLCWDSNLVIERAFCHNKKGENFSLYDIRKMPNLLASTATFVISSDNTLVNTPIV